MMKDIRSFGLFALFLLVACDPLESIENVYADYQAVISAGAIERGWIPIFLPHSAKEIREKHNLDTNEIWLRFSLSPDELSVIEKTCHSIAQGMVSYPRRSAGDWWPDALIEKSGVQLQASEYEYYLCDNGALIAVVPNSKWVFYWHLG